MNECLTNLRKADPNYQHWVNLITTQAKFKSLKVFAADTANACATKTGILGEHVITYNPEFFHGLSDLTIFAILAHEVGHHYNRDIGNARFEGNLIGFSNSHKRELRADYFAGWMVRVFSEVSLDVALREYASIGFEQTSSHPSERNRLAAFQVGWRSANAHAVPPVQRTQSSNALENVDWGKVAGFAGIALLFGLGISAIRNAS